jgi:hypothetical protein
VSVADDKLNAPRILLRTAPPRTPSLRGRWAALRERRPALAALIGHGLEIVVWIAFYLIIRALLG